MMATNRTMRARNAVAIGAALLLSAGGVLAMGGMHHMHGMGEDAAQGGCMQGERGGPNGHGHDMHHRGMGKEATMHHGHGMHGMDAAAPAPRPAPPAADAPNTAKPQ